MFCAIAEEFKCFVYGHLELDPQLDENKLNPLLSSAFHLPVMCLHDVSYLCIPKDRS